jgi:hypothetical protein
MTNHRCSFHCLLERRILAGMLILVFPIALARKACTVHSPGKRRVTGYIPWIQKGLPQTKKLGKVETLPAVT